MARRGAARYNGEDESTLARGRQHAGVYGPVHQAPASDTYRCVNVLSCALPIPLSRSRERSRICCVREWERKEERAHTYVCVYLVPRLCARPVHKSVGSPSSGATLHLLLSVSTSFFYLPARPTHMCMCTLVFSVRSEPVENARYCYIIIIVIVRSRSFAARSRRRGLLWLFRVDTRAIPRDWLRRKSDFIQSVDHACMYQAPGVNERNVRARMKRAVRDSFHPFAADMRISAGSNGDTGCVLKPLLWQYGIVRCKHVSTSSRFYRRDLFASESQRGPPFKFYFALKKFIDCLLRKQVVKKYRTFVSCVVVHRSPTMIKI